MIVVPYNSCSCPKITVTILPKDNHNDYGYILLWLLLPKVIMTIIVTFPICQCPKITIMIMVLCNSCHCLKITIIIMVTYNSF